MITEHIHKVKNFYDAKGQNKSVETIENCFLMTASAYSISPEEVYSIISPYFYDTTAANKHDDPPTLIQPMAIVQASLDFTNIMEPYDITVDDQAANIIPYSQQEYLSTDFRKKVVFRFPIFDEHSFIPPKFGKLKYYQAQKQIREILPKLENINWTNQTLSYARSNIVGKHIVECIIYPLFKKGLFGRVLNVVDATGNIGADSITFAMERFVESVKVYEILPNVYNMLIKNIELYGMGKKIKAFNKRFDYVVPENSLVIIDPPYEADNNKGNYNLSIDTMPIYCVAQRLLEAGAVCILLSMPKTYKYNTKFAIDHDQHVSVYQMGKINNKMYLVTKLNDAKRIGLIDFNYTLVTTDETQKAWNGKTNAYKCKSNSMYTLDDLPKTRKSDEPQYMLTLPIDVYNALFG